MNRLEVEAKLKQGLKDWGIEIETLKAKAKEQSGQAKKEIEKHISELQLKETEASGKLKELMAASDSAWQDVKTGIDLAWESLSEAVKSATERFK